MAFIGASAHGIGEKTHIIFHDMAHSYDLLVGDVYKKLAYIAETIHKSYSERLRSFSRSSHQRRRLEFSLKHGAPMICFDALSLPSSKPPITFCF
jgi:hypothetical protein